MTSSSPQDCYLASRRRCKVILIVGTALFLSPLLTLALSQMGFGMFRFEAWLINSELLEGISGLIFFGTFLLLLYVHHNVQIADRKCPSLA